MIFPFKSIHFCDHIFYNLSFFFLFTTTTTTIYYSNKKLLKNEEGKRRIDNSTSGWDLDGPSFIFDSFKVSRERRLTP